MQKIMFGELERHGLERMKFNAFKVRDEFTSRIDGAPMLNGFMRSQTFLLISQFLLNNEEYLKTFVRATTIKKIFNFRLKLFSNAAKFY